MLHDAPIAVQKMFAEIMQGIEQAEREGEARRAAADPLAHKLSRTFPAGVELNYRFFSVKVGKREVRYCHSVNRNVAGFYLGWRETITPKEMHRDMWTSRRVKARVIELCRSRIRAHRARLNGGK